MRLIAEYCDEDYLEIYDGETGRGAATSFEGDGYGDGVLSNGHGYGCGNGYVTGDGIGHGYGHDLTAYKWTKP